MITIGPEFEIMSTYSEVTIDKQSRWSGVKLARHCIPSAITNIGILQGMTKQVTHTSKLVSNSMRAIMQRMKLVISQYANLLCLRFDCCNIHPKNIANFYHPLKVPQSVRISQSRRGGFWARQPGPKPHLDEKNPGTTLLNHCKTDSKWP